MRQSQSNCKHARWTDERANSGPGLMTITKSSGVNFSSKQSEMSDSVLCLVWHLVADEHHLWCKIKSTSLLASFVLGRSPALLELICTHEGGVWRLVGVYDRTGSEN